MTGELQCWKCGASFAGPPEHLGRLDTCSTCRAELYVCRMCEFFDPKISHSCREPVADEVKDKERANFCGYFQIRPDAFQPHNDAAASAAKSQLDTLFGSGGTEEPPADSTRDIDISIPADTADEQLERLFSRNQKE